MLQPKKPMNSRVHLVLPDDLYRDIKFRADAAGITVAEAIRQYLEIAVRKDSAEAPSGAVGNGHENGHAVPPGGSATSEAS